MFRALFQSPRARFFVVDLMEMQIRTVAPFALKQCVTEKYIRIKYKIQHQKKKVLIDVLPAGLFHIEMNFIDMYRGFTQSLLTDLLGL